MVLITQLFAPFDVDRSLYVYACTNDGCASSSDGWMVFRNEAKANSSASQPSQPVAPVKVAAPAPAAAKKPATSVWSFDDAGTGDDNIDDLLAMLEVRDKSLEASQSAEAAPTKPTTTSASTGKATEKIDETRLVRTPKQLACYEIEDFEEDWDLTLERTEEDDLTAKVDEAHVHRLLETYFRDEEDREHVDKLQQQFRSRPGGGGGGGGGGGDPEEDDDDDDNDVDEGSDGGDDSDEDERPATKKKSGAKAAAAAPAAGAARAAKAGKAPSSSVKLERYFHRRVSRHPSQVLRYAYGGSPLWSSALPPLTATGRSDSGAPRSTALEEATRNVPPCPWCRKARVFEFQLMPGLLSVWPSCAQLPTATVRGTTAATTTTAAAAGSATTGSTDLDFGVVAVFTCPDSCSPPPGQVAYESVLVQPAIDSVAA